MEKEGQIWVSVITVCYTCRQVIEQTMRSVLEQNYPFVEYIVIDGASKDGTKEEIERLAPLFREKGYRFHMISEPDHGIYDAMNKAAAKATGDYILFLNAGDTFANCEVIKNVVSFLFLPILLRLFCFLLTPLILLSLCKIRKQ